MGGRCPHTKGIALLGLGGAPGPCDSGISTGLSWSHPFSVCCSEAITTSPGPCSADPPSLPASVTRRDSHSGKGMGTHRCQGGKPARAGFHGCLEHGSPYPPVQREEASPVPTWVVSPSLCSHSSTGFPPPSAATSLLEIPTLGTATGWQREESATGSRTPRLSCLQATQGTSTLAP